MSVDRPRRRRSCAEQPSRLDAADIETAAEQAEAHARRVLAVARQDPLHADGLAACPLGPSAGEIAALPLLPNAAISTVCPPSSGRNLDAVAAIEREHRRAAALDDIALDARVERRRRRRDQSWAEAADVGCAV